MQEYKFKGYIRPSSVRIGGDDFYNLYKRLHSDDMEDRACEVIIRIRDKRQDWIDKYYKLAKHMANAGTYVIKHCKEVCYVIPCGYAGNAASATPRHGDKYDYKTGVAVAFAKAFGDRVPDYI